MCLDSSVLATELQVCRPSLRIIAISLAASTCDSLIGYYISNLIVECNREEPSIFVNILKAASLTEASTFLFALWALIFLDMIVWY